MPKINAPTIDEHKVQTRVALLEAGANSFVEHGLSGTSIGALADMAGIGRTTVYEYFPNKESLLADLILERLPPIVERVLCDLPHGDIVDRLTAIMRRSLLFVDEFPIETALLFKASRELPKPQRDDVWSVLYPIRSEVADLCRQLVASGQLEGVDATSLGTTVRDHVVGAIDELSERGKNDAESIIATRIRFVRRGLGVND